MVERTRAMDWKDVVERLRVFQEEIDEVLGRAPRKQVVYVAGPYRDERGEWWVRENIRRAEAAALVVWRMGGVAICPHKNTAGFGGALGEGEEVWIEGDLELVRRCDALWAIEGWEGSVGARREVEEAREWGVEVFFSDVEVGRFLGFNYGDAI